MTEGIHSHQLFLFNTGFFFTAVVLLNFSSTHFKPTRLSVAAAQAARQTQTILKSPTGPKGGVVPSEMRLSNQPGYAAHHRCLLSKPTQARPTCEVHVLPFQALASADPTEVWPWHGTRTFEHCAKPHHSIFPGPGLRKA